MVSTKATGGKRLRRRRNMTLLDEKRLRTIKKRIAQGYYNRKEVRMTIAERVSERVIQRSEGDEAEP
ncbi:MAG: hypothetical protein JSW03_10795 [Candidatus Eiseniibacteriota bacterium]|nr:MAG: hypothetical protein JSW03_10795 [Candidatus Eisenbacteria bacterium]